MAEEQISSWLKYESKRTGKTVKQIRAEMADRGSKVDPSKRGLASNPKAASEAANKRWAAHNARKKGNNEKN